MDKLDQIKKIISQYVKLPPDNINASTVIDKTVIQGSILIHRMYAELSEMGVKVDNYMNIKTFGQLLEKINIALEAQEEVAPKAEKEEKTMQANSSPASESNTQTSVGLNNSVKTSSILSIGIDIEQVANMPKAKDFREHEFYKNNFTDREISYCLLQADPIQCFAGKFAAKEAIIKADSAMQKEPLKNIEILNTLDGKPHVPGYEISLSHTKEYAVAVALKVSQHPQLQDNQIPRGKVIVKKTIPLFYKVLIISAFLFSALALALTLLC